MIYTTYDTTHLKNVDAITYFQQFPTKYDSLITKKDNQYIITIPLPKWENNTKQVKLNLSKCYYDSLQLAVDNNIKSIAFSVVSTILPVQTTAQIAISSISDFLRNNKKDIDVWFVFDDTRTKTIYDMILNNLGNKQT